MTDLYNIRIRDLPAEERPREKLERYGAGALGIAELLAILLRVGNAKASALQLAQHLIARFGGLRGLAGATVQELSGLSGIGLAKACQLKAAFEVGKRLATAADAPRPIISSPLDAANLLMEDLRYRKEERFTVLLLDTRHQVIRVHESSIGTLSASLVHPREVFRAAITHTAAAVILAHNHPSGDPTPSKEDRALTARLTQAGDLVGIPVLDHLVIGDGRFVSMKEQGLI